MDEKESASQSTIASDLKAAMPHDFVRGSYGLSSGEFNV